MRYFLLALTLFFSFSLLEAKTKYKKGDYAQVYDCFVLFNEWEVLEVRLHEMYPHVDKFVIIDAQESIYGRKKGSSFADNKKKFEDFLDKIICIPVECLATEDTEARAQFQKDQILKGLQWCKDEDLILISDIEEMIPPENIPALKKQVQKQPSVAFSQKVYKFFLNRTPAEPTYKVGTVAVKFGKLKNRTPTAVQKAVIAEKAPIWQGGWVFSSMGSYYQLVEKTGYDKGYYQWCAEAAAHPLVPIDTTYPTYIQNNINYLYIIGLIDCY